MQVIFELHAESSLAVLSLSFDGNFLHRLYTWWSSFKIRTISNCFNNFENFKNIKSMDIKIWCDCKWDLSDKKQKDSLEGILDGSLFASELEFPKILVPRLPKKTPHVNTEYARKLKQLFFYVISLLDHQCLYFIALILICVFTWLCPVTTVQYMSAARRGQLQV